MLRENKRVRENLGSENIRGAKIKEIKVSYFMLVSIYTT